MITETLTMIIGVLVVFLPLVPYLLDGRALAFAKSAFDNIDSLSDGFYILFAVIIIFALFSNYLRFHFSLVSKLKLLKKALIGIGFAVLSFVLGIFFAGTDIFIFLPYMIYEFVCGVLVLSKLKILSNYSNCDNLNFQGKIFRKNAKFPKNPSIFLEGNDIFFKKTILPKINFNDYNFNEAFFINIVFTKDSILPEDTEFFQKILGKRIYGATMPCGDYSKYNFKGVTMNNVIFPKECVFPENHSFFRELYYIYGEKGSFTLPSSTIKKLHLYDLSNKEYLYFDNKQLSEIQIALLYLKAQ